MKKLLLILLCVPLIFSCGEKPEKENIDMVTLNTTYDNIYGLTEGSPVMSQGYQVGNVTDIIFPEEELFSFYWQDKVLVVFVVSNDKNVPQNSTAELVSMDSMGTKGINLILGDAKEKATNNLCLISSIELSLQEDIQKEEKTESVCNCIEQAEMNSSISDECIVILSNEGINFKNKNELERSIKKHNCE